MRLSKLFKLSFVGTLIFSPGMAQQAEDVHDQALKVLRGSETNRSNATAAAPATPAARGAETRAERQERLKEEARRAMEERDRVQAEKRRQFEEYVKERERLREQKAGTDTGVAVHDKALEVLRQNPAPAQAPAVTAAPVSPAPVAPPTAAPAPAAVAPAAPANPDLVAQPVPAATQSNEDIQQRALEILRQQRTQPSTSATPVTEAEVAPRVVAPTAPPQSAPTVATPAGDNADVHQKALEVLRQQQPQSSVSGSSLAPSNTRSAPPAAQDDLKPSPELQKRLDEMQRELQNEQRRSSAAPVVDESYKKDLEQRAREMMQQRTPAPVAATAAPAPRQTAPVATPAPRLDPQTTDIIRRQNQQLSSQGSAAVSASSARPTLDPSAEERARNILRQQQQAAASTASPQPAAQAPAQTSAPAPATTASTFPSAPSAAGSDVQYSRELEERARQILMQRQGQPPAATAATSAPASAANSPEAAAAAAAAAEVSRAPITTDPELSRVHSRALQTLTQVEPGENGQARLKSKQERLRALTDLYRADRMTPAEYHQRRAQIIAEEK